MMTTEYQRLCELYSSDLSMDLNDWREATRLLGDLIADLKAELGLTPPTQDEIVTSSPFEPDVEQSEFDALDVTPERSWVVLLTVFLKRMKQLPEWHGAHFRFRVELKPVAEGFYNVSLWNGAAPIRVRLGVTEHYSVVSRSICAAIEGKIKDPKAPGPDRFLKRQPRRSIFVTYKTKLGPDGDFLATKHVNAVPRVGESILIGDDVYRVKDVVWFLDDTSDMSVTVLLSTPPTAVASLLNDGS